MTCNVVEALAPGARFNMEFPKTAVHPLATVAPKLKLDGEQPELSLLVTEIVKLTIAPACTYWLCEGDSEITGFAATHVAAPNVTFTVAPVLLTVVGEIVIPEVASV